MLDTNVVRPLVIIGAGPHALTLVLALLEPTPQDSYSAKQEELRDFWRSKLGMRPEVTRINDLTVIDPQGVWNARWNSSFEAYGISHLRSPVLVHPDPARPEGLRAFALQRERWKDETKAIKLFAEHNVRTRRHGSVKGKRNRMSHGSSMFTENDREAFTLPAQSLFRDFCQDLERRYGLDELNIIRSKVVHIDPIPVDGQGTHFRLRLADGRQIVAACVVSAIGTCNLARVPATLRPVMHQHNILHSLDLAQDVVERGLEKVARERFLDQRVAIVGGGLTSVHLCSQALRHGAKHVTLITRRDLQIQQFDVPMSWVSPKFRNCEMVNFQTESQEGRLGIIQRARNGGTITNEALQGLHRVATSSNFGHLAYTTVTSIEPIDSTTCRLMLESRGKKSDSVQLEVQQVFIATGTNVDARFEPIFQGLLNAPDPPPLYQGLPVLDNNLRWKPDWNFFIIGGYAALELGPMALNLTGAKAAASRLRETLEDLLLPENDSGGEWLDVMCHNGNMFEHLVLGQDEL